MKLKTIPFALIKIIIFKCILWVLISFKMHCKRLLQIQDLQDVKAALVWKGFNVLQPLQHSTRFLLRKSNVYIVTTYVHFLCWACFSTLHNTGLWFENLSNSTSMQYTPCPRETWYTMDILAHLQQTLAWIWL